TISLTAGTDTSPQINYIYILQSTLLLTVSTSSFPSAEHAPIATVLCQTAASLQTDGAYKVHAWTDHISGSDDQGHLAHLNAWIRCQNATWTSGVVLTPSVGAATFDVATTSGVILQLHDHAFPVFDTSTGSEIYMVNYPGDNFKVAQNLTQTYVDVDANGTTLGTAATDFYNLVIWGAVNEASGDCKLFVNLPDGAYNNDSGSKASNDDDNTAVYTIPADFTGVGFLIARLTVSEVAGTYTIEQNQDLRGSFPSTAAGGGSSGGSEFADNVFRIQDDGDATKEISFQASSITTGTVRTIIMPDADVNLGTDFESADVDILKADTDDNLAAGFSTTAHDIGELNAETYVAIAEGGNIKTCNNGEGQTDLDPMVATGTVIIEVTNDAEATTAFTTNSFTKVSGDDHLTTSGFTYLYYLTTVGSESHCYIQAMQ
ncbi:MAG: hypothetical protein GY941_20160, partial [Planctomycetes bacterium]|nr:hypothetical protein [Planctomycetota bacterium]